MSHLLLSDKEQEEVADSLADMRRISLSDRQLCDLEMLLNGGFTPLKGFLNKDDYESVVTEMRLASGELWPIPIVLDVKDEDYKVGESVLLCNQYFKPLAILDIESKYNPEKHIEAKEVYGTTDDAHFGVRVLFDETEEMYLGGTVRGLELPSYTDFPEIRHTPDELKAHFKKEGIKKVVAFQTRNPMHRAHFEIMKHAAEEVGAHALIHPVVGQTKTGDIDYMTRVRSYKKVHEKYAKDFSSLSLLPLAMRMAGPREALWHALIRKNYGATHFIVGRDHAGPGKDNKGQSFYDPYAAQDMVRTHEKEIGVSMVTPQEMVYVAEREVFLPRDEVKADETIKNISGTELRTMVREGEDVPEWFSFPEVIYELRQSVMYKKQQGLVLFFTGLSGSGKTTVAELVVNKLRELQSREITFLDGDVVRLNLSKGLGFSKDDRNANIERIGFVAGEVARHGGIAVCCAIAPYEQSRHKNREHIGEFGKYVEIYVSTPIEECKKRDIKGLYEKAEKGLIKGFTGVDDPYEVPSRHEIELDTTNLTKEEGVEKIIGYLQDNNLLQ